MLPFTPLHRESNPKAVFTGNNAGTGNKILFQKQLSKHYVPSVALENKPREAFCIYTLDSVLHIQVTEKCFIHREK